MQKHIFHRTRTERQKVLIFSLYFFVFGVALSSCMPSELVTTPAWTNTSTTSSTSTPRPTPVFTPGLMDASFTQISIAHQNVQAFSEHLNFQLLVKTSEDKMSVFNFSTMEIENEQILSGSVVGYPVVNGNGVLIAQIIRQDDKKFLRIKNFLTGEESSVTLPNEAVLPKWLDHKKLAIWGGSSDVQCEGLLLIYDTSTVEVTYPEYPMPDLQKSECLRLPFLTADGTKMIYPWQMFDFQTGTSNAVLSFMRNVSEFPPSYLLKEADGNISIAYINGDKLGYLLNIPLAEINKVDLTPELALLPGLGTKDAWWQPFTWVSGQMQIEVDLIAQDTDLGELIASYQQVPTKFYLIDLIANKIFDYDLDRAVFIEGSLPQRIRNGFASPDGKYFAWTIYDSSSGLPIGSKVLELSSGSIVSIPEIEILGWIASKAE